MGTSLSACESKAASLGSNSFKPVLQAVQAELQEAVRELRESPLQAQHAERQFKQQLAALPALKAKQAEPDNPFGLHHRITDEPGTLLLAYAWDACGLDMCRFHMCRIPHMRCCTPLPHEAC